MSFIQRDPVPREPSTSSGVTGANDKYDIVINGANIAHRYYEAVHPERGRGFDWKGIKVALDYYIERGAHPVAVVKDCTLQNCRIPTRYRRDHIIAVPSRDNLGKDGDDLFSLRVAMEHNCYILDNDNYRDWKDRLKGKDDRLQEWFERTKTTFHISYTIGGNGTFYPQTSDLLPVNERPQGPLSPRTFQRKNSPRRSRSQSPAQRFTRENTRNERNLSRQNSPRFDPDRSRTSPDLDRGRGAYHRGRSGSPRAYNRSRSYSPGRSYREGRDLVDRSYNDRSRSLERRSRSRSPRGELRHRRGTSPDRDRPRPRGRNSPISRSPSLVGAPPPLLPPSCRADTDTAQQMLPPVPNFPNKVGDSDLTVLSPLTTVEQFMWDKQLARVIRLLPDGMYQCIVLKDSKILNVYAHQMQLADPSQFTEIVALAPNQSTGASASILQHPPAPKQQAIPPPPTRQAYPDEPVMQGKKKKNGASSSRPLPKDWKPWKAPNSHCKRKIVTDEQKTNAMCDLHRIWSDVDAEAEHWRAAIPEADGSIRIALKRIGYNTDDLFPKHRVHVCGGIECVRKPQSSFELFGLNSGRVSVGCLRCNHWADWLEHQKHHPPTCPCADDESDEEEDNMWREWMEWPEGSPPNPPFSNMQQIIQSLESKGYHVNHDDVLQTFKCRNLDIQKHGNKNAKLSYWWLTCNECGMWKKSHW